MPAFKIQRIDPTDSRRLVSFVNMPEGIYRDIPQYVPPLYLELKRKLDPRRNPYFDHSSAAFFLAIDQSGLPVARVACLNHTVYNEFNQEKTAFFHLFESQDLPEASNLLFEHAAVWARSQGLTMMVGPRGFSTLDGLGLLVEGFDYPPALGIPYNPAYYPTLIENAGFHVSNEIISGTLQKGFSLDEKIPRIAALVQERRGLEITRFRNRSELRKFLPKLQELYNHAIQGTSGNYPITQTEARAMASQMLWFADPSLIKIITKDNKPVGFLFAYPDITHALQRSKGRLFPLGWFYILHGLRVTQRVDVNGMGMLEEYRGSGGTALLFNEIVGSFNNSRHNQIEIVQIGTENTRMLRELSGFGIKFHKKHRLYLINL